MNALFCNCVRQGVSKLLRFCTQAESTHRLIMGHGLLNKRMILPLLLGTALAASPIPPPGYGEEVGSGDPFGLLLSPSPVGSSEVGSGDTQLVSPLHSPAPPQPPSPRPASQRAASSPLPLGPSDAGSGGSPPSPGSGEVGSGDSPPPPSPASATLPPPSPMPPLAQIDVSERAAGDAGGVDAVVTADHVLIAVVSASMAALAVFVIMMGVRSVLRGGRKAGSAAEAGDTEGDGSERSEAARERAQRWGAASAAGHPTADVWLEVDDAGAYEPRAPSSRAGGELDGDMALTQPNAQPDPPMG